MISLDTVVLASGGTYTTNNVYYNMGDFSREVVWANTGSQKFDVWGAQSLLDMYVVVMGPFVVDIKHIHHRLSVYLTWLFDQNVRC